MRFLLSTIVLVLLLSVASTHRGNPEHGSPNKSTMRRRGGQPPMGGFQNRRGRMQGQGGFRVMLQRGMNQMKQKMKRFENKMKNHFETPTVLKGPMLMAHCTNNCRNECNAHKECVYANCRTCEGLERMHLRKCVIRNGCLINVKRNCQKPKQCIKCKVACKKQVGRCIKSTCSEECGYQQTQTTNNADDNRNSSSSWGDWFQNWRRQISSNGTVVTEEESESGHEGDKGRFNQLKRRWPMRLQKKGRWSMKRRLQHQKKSFKTAVNTVQCKSCVDECKEMEPEVDGIEGPEDMQIDNLSDDKDYFDFEEEEEENGFVESIPPAAEGVASKIVIPN